MIVQTLYFDRDLLRLLVTPQNDPDSIVLTNADMLARMAIPGDPAASTSLRDVWDFATLTQAQARLRCVEAGWNRIGTYQRTSPDPVAIDISVDAGGRPQLVLSMAKANGGTCVVDIEYRLRREETAAAEPMPVLRPGG